MSPSAKSSFSRSGVGSGKLVVAAMILIAAILAGITVWHHWSKGYASIAYWGAANGENIRYAPVVELKTAGQTYEISKARGLVHFRQALIEDASFTGATSKEETQPTWTHEVVFSWPDQSKSTVVQFDVEKGVVASPDQQSVLVAKPEPTLSGLKTFFADVIATAG